MADNFLDRAIGFLSGSGGAGGGDSDRAILLRQTAKDLSQNKFGKFYRPRPGDADPSLGAFFSSVSETVRPLTEFFQEPFRDGAIRQAVIDTFLSSAAQEIARRVSPEAVEARGRAVPPAELARQLEEDAAALEEAARKSPLAAADECFRLITAMRDFAAFDFAALLQKFAPEAVSKNAAAGGGESAAGQMKFAPVKLETLAGELAAFDSLASALNPEDNWKAALGVLKTCSGGAEPLSLESWLGLLAHLRELRESRALEMLIRLAFKNPVWEKGNSAEAAQETGAARITAPWLEERRRFIRETIRSIAESQRSARIAALADAVFPALDTVRLENYTPDASGLLTAKGLASYTYARGLNYLFTFIQEYLDRDIHDICDILLIRGQWTDNAVSLELSEACHTAAEAGAGITRLDKSLSEESSSGARLRSALFRVERDRLQERYTNSIIGSINAEALTLINGASQALIVIGKRFKSLYEDTRKNPSELIINWKDLGRTSTPAFARRINNAYRTINYFVQLMSLETHPVVR